MSSSSAAGIHPRSKDAGILPERLVNPVRLGNRTYRSGAITLLLYLFLRSSYFGDTIMSELLSLAQALENQQQIPQAIQAYEDVIRGDADSQTLAIANHRLGVIYKDWSEYIAANRFFANAHRLYPENTDIRNSVDSLTGILL